MNFLKKNLFIKMAGIITTKDLSVEDTSELKTGDIRKGYNMAKKPLHTWPDGKKLHPVGMKHTRKNGSKVQGSETPNFFYNFPKNKYKEGK